MTKCAILLFFATIAASFYGSLTESPGTQEKLENIEAQLHNLRMGQDRTELQLDALLLNVLRLQTALTKTGNFSKFQPIGSRFFYIESENTETWTTAAITCAQLGGHLASISNQEELSLITRKLPEGKGYWLDINDEVNEGEYMSATTGRHATFLKWGRNHPNDLTGNRDCVFLAYGSMAEAECNLKLNFICEADI